MQIAWKSAEAGGETPGGLAGWVLGLVRRETRTGMKHLRLVEHLSLGGRRQICLVTCDGERFLVGGGMDGVETIVRVGPAETPCL